MARFAKPCMPGTAAPAPVAWPLASAAKSLAILAWLLAAWIGGHVVGSHGAFAADVVAADADTAPSDAAAARKVMQEAVDRAQSGGGPTAAPAAAPAAAVADDLASANRQLKDAQGQLVQAAKMASLGELVAGIAHEINNPLAFLLGHQDTVERLIATAADETPSPGLDKARARLASMRVGMKRIQDLVLNLRKFSRLDEGDRHVLDAADSIETVLALLTHKLGDGIEVRRAYAARNTLEGSPALLNQVVMNIVGNAADALEGPNGGQGVISISTRDEAGDFVIVVEDSGPGVPPDLRDRIFEPFFTTKPVGAGTGLGLAIAYNVVRAHGGAIAIDQGELGGARFTITIPPPVTDGEGR
jgi:two-component system NtrC family sensor kinase